MNVIIIGNTNNFDIALALIKDSHTNIIAGIVDNFNSSLETSQKKFLKDNHIKEISFEDVEKYQPDICLILGCNKIIPTQYFSKTILLNIHGGILPKWRGSSTNAWAVINGEKEVGYSLHEATEILDGGDIYYVYKSEIKPDEKYGDIIPKLRQGMIENLPKILQDIADKKLRPVSQVGKQHLYTPRLRKSDGVITDWNRPSKYIYNLFRVMGAPYGTGVFLKYREDLYEIKEMNLVNSCPDYIGIPGAIVYSGKDFLYIKTADNIIEVKTLVCNEKQVDIQKIFRIGMRL